MQFHPHPAAIREGESLPSFTRDTNTPGPDSLTGGGAEIFRKEVRSAIARAKESAEEYLDVHRTWHKMSGRSTCTMLYGHVESLPDRADHLRQLRGCSQRQRRALGDSCEQPCHGVARRLRPTE